MRFPIKPTTNPILMLFLRLTAVVAIAIVGLIVFGFLLKIVLIAAIIAALAVGGFFLYSWFRRGRSAVSR